MKRLVTSKNLATFLLFFAGANYSYALPAAQLMGDPVFFLGPQGQAMGGAIYSLRFAHDSLLVNPSAGAFSQEYAIDGTFSTAARTLGASVFDTKSTTYGGGLTYLRREVDSETNPQVLKAGTLQQLYQSASVSMFGKLQDTFAIGITGRYSMRDNTGSNDMDATSWNADVNATFKFNDKIGIGASYKNIFGDKKNIEPRVLGAGAHFEFYPGLTASASLEKYSQPSNDHKYEIPDESKPVWTFAAQYKHESGVSIRAAYRDQGPWESQTMFGGIGYESNGFHVDYALANVSKGDNFNVHTFGLGMTF